MSSQRIYGTIFEGMVLHPSSWESVTEKKIKEWKDNRRHIWLAFPNGDEATEYLNDQKYMYLDIGALFRKMEPQLAIKREDCDKRLNAVLKDREIGVIYLKDWEAPNSYRSSVKGYLISEETYRAKILSFAQEADHPD